MCGTNQPATKMGKREILGVEDPQDFALFSAKKHLPFSYTLVSFSFSPLFPVLLLPCIYVHNYQVKIIERQTFFLLNPTRE